VNENNKTTAKSNIKQVKELTVKYCCQLFFHLQSPMKSSNSNSKIFAATQIFFEASLSRGIGRCHSLIDGVQGWQLVRKR
jgi:hypothetical protein